MIYLDNSATSLKKPPAVEQAIRYAMQHLANPGRGGHQAASAAAAKVYACRERAGILFDCEPEQVTFTMNATHGLNLAIKTLVQLGDHVVISGFEHNAVYRPLYRLGARIDVVGRQLFDPQDTLNAFYDAVRPGVCAVVCTHVSNVFGYILPLGEIAALCRERGVPLIVDASQSAGCLPVSLRQTDAAFIAMPGHKGLYGPQGTGLLLCGRMPEPLLEGGTGSLSRQPDMPDFLPDRVEAGTQNVPGICGLSEGIRFVQQLGTQRILRHEKSLCSRLAAGLSAMGLHCFTGLSQTGVLSVSAPMDCETLAERLASRGCAVRAGLHCAPLAHESAGTLECGTVRFSPSAFTTEQEIRQTLQTVRVCLGKEE